MIRIAVIGFFVCLVALSGVSAQERGVSSTLGGGCGLLLMQSARTLGEGNLVAGAGGLVLHAEPGGGSGHPQIFTVPVTYGLTDEIDLTAAVYGYRDARALLDNRNLSAGYGPPGGGIGASYFGVKVRLPFSPKSRVQIAGRFGGSMDISRDELSGLNYIWTRQGTTIESTIHESFDLTPFLSLHLGQGYAMSGSGIYDDQLMGAAGVEVKVRDRVRIGFEIDNRTFLGVGPQSVFWAESHPSAYAGSGSVPAFLGDSDADFGRDYLVCAPSVSVQVNDRTAFTLGAVYNLSDQASSREKYQIAAGITFRTNVRSMIDSDGDGIPNLVDAEDDTPAGYPVDKRGIALDTDGDGIPDGRDREKDSPHGAVVDRDGVATDVDGDRVCDGLDLEPQTPFGASVNRFGVALDEDHDGIPDGFDREAGTPHGAVTGRDGVALDGDGDGVPDGIDVEWGTLPGARVDLAGASLDGDGDGVPDGIDEEMNTPKGVLTDRRGRSLTRGPDGFPGAGFVRINSLRFDAAGVAPGPELFPALDEIGRLLRKYPGLQIQIEGHTDNAGSREKNYRVSRERAKAVLEYLLEKFPDLSRDRLRVIGFGSEKPVADNATPEGRRENRRVDFVVINRHDAWRAGAGE